MGEYPCGACGTATARPLLDLGRQPLTNRFLTAVDAPEETFRFVLAVCSRCGLTQLAERASAEHLTPRVDWLTYNEPERHLDRLVDQLTALPGMGRNTVVCGLSFKDDTTLRRLRERGFANTWRVEPRTDLNVDNPCAGIETIQGRFDVARAEALARAHGRPRIAIARHMLEHSHDVAGFLAALRALVGIGGYVVVEMPDCTRSLDLCDYSMFWEEHLYYFTPLTLRELLEGQGFEVCSVEVIELPQENAMVAIGRVVGLPRGVTPSPEAEAEAARARRYAAEFPGRKAATTRALAQARQTHGPLAMFGAGHLAAGFLNLLEVVAHFAFVVDDHPKKQGLFMPGSRLPILGSATLIERDIRLCLLSVNPESETKVRQNNARFVERGGAFASIFPASPTALRLHTMEGSP